MSIGIYLVTNQFPALLFLLLFVFSGFAFFIASTQPERLALRWRLKASSQMVPCILYLVVYMRHTSNLERALQFAAENLPDPMASELKQVFWKVEIGKYSTVKESLDAWLESWRDFALEFVEAMYLIESSLYEPTEARRIAILEKSIAVILDGVHEKMINFSHEVKAPLTNLFMLGIVLPTLGLALLPLAATLLGGMLKWQHVAILYNLIIPFLVFWLSQGVLAKRPGGFGEAQAIEQNPFYEDFKSNKPWLIATLLLIPFLLIGFLPFLLYHYGPSLGLKQDYNFTEFNLKFFGDAKFWDFRQVEKQTTGPFGLLALICSFAIPFGLASSLALVYKLKTKRLIEVRKKTEKLELEFASGLFQLGNRLADGIPAEIAFSKVASTLRGTETGQFFAIINSNLQQGFSLQEAIFNRKKGALIYFPSDLVKTSMRVLVETVKKGVRVAALALMSISTYVKNIHRAQERLKDLLAEVTSGMKSNATFLAPILAGIVVGLAAMITLILTRLSILMQGQTVQEGMLGGLTNLMTLFQVNAMIPPYFMQLIVSIYLIEMIFILTSTLVSIEKGPDELTEKYLLGDYLLKGISFYLVVALLSALALSIFAGLAIGGGFL